MTEGRTFLWYFVVFCGILWYFVVYYYYIYVIITFIKYNICIILLYINKLYLCTKRHYGILFCILHNG